MPTSHIFNFTRTALAAALAVVSMSGYALEAMGDAELSGKTGEGLAYFAENFSLKMGETDYIKMTSAAGDVDQLAALEEKKGEFYLYGMQIGGSNSGETGNNGSAGNRNVIPVDVGSASNPSLIRVYKATGEDGTGVTMRDGSKQFIDVFAMENPTRPDAANLYATNDYSTSDGAKENWKIAWWADYIARDGVNYTDSDPINPEDRLRMQFIFGDKISLAGTKAELWQRLDGKIALTGFVRSNMAKDGVLRLTVAQDDTNNPAITTNIQTDKNKARYGDAYVTGVAAPNFNKFEGIYWQNYHNNMPLGALGWQPVVISAGGESGRELILEGMRIPNIAAVYDKAYIDYDDVDGSGNLSVAQQKKMCDIHYCPPTATHANLKFQLHTKNQEGKLYDPASNYYGAGVGGIASGSAGISPSGRTPFPSLHDKQIIVDGTATTVGANGGGYTKLGGLFLQHLKLTTNAFD